MAPRLFTFPGSKNASKALIVAELNGTTLEVPPFEMDVSNKTPAFLALNPFGKVPVLETEEGAGVFESNAIARYVARLKPGSLLGSSPTEAAQVDMWIDYSSNEVDGPLCSWIYPIWGVFKYDKHKEEAAKEALRKSFGVLDTVLQGRTYLVGHGLTLADVVMVCNLHNGFKHLFDAAFRAPYPSLVRYYTTVSNQPAVLKVLGACTLCDAPLAWAPPKAGDAAAAAAKPAAAAAAAPAAAAAAAAAAPKAEKPAAAPKPAKAAAPKKAEEEDDDGEEPPPPPKKNPLDELPKSKMVLDSWKRLYSNTPATDFATVCAAGLWAGADIPKSPTNEHFEGFDADGYSLWFIEHKFPEEQKVQYRALNAVSGFFQRCDYARKHAFSVISILQDKAAGNFPIRGFWIFRGQEVNWQMKEECDDLEVFTLTKADTADPAVRERVRAFICEDATIDGLENVEAKVFK